MEVATDFIAAGQVSGRVTCIDYLNIKFDIKVI